MIFSVGYGVKNFDTICENALHETSEVPCSIVRLFSIVLLHVFPGMLSGLFCDPEEHQIIRKDQKRKTGKNRKIQAGYGQRDRPKKRPMRKNSSSAEYLSVLGMCLWFYSILWICGFMGLWFSFFMCFLGCRTFLKSTEFRFYVVCGSPFRDDRHF